MKISEKVLEFFGEKDVQYALRSNDMQELYKLTVDRQVSLLASDIGELTSILMQADIDPLEGMTEIPVYFLCRQEGIKSFSIPVGITKINSYAFAYTDLESITIPSSVREIDREAFHMCKNLKTIKLPTGVELNRNSFSSSGLESIELRDVKLQNYFIFYDCKQLKSVTVKGDTPVIPDWTFANCFNLTHIELPGALKQVESHVFYGCRKLREINFAGTVNQWREIEIDGINRELFNCKITCSDGTLKYDSDAGEWKQV